MEAGLEETEEKTKYNICSCLITRIKSKIICVKTVNKCSENVAKLKYLGTMKTKSAFMKKLKAH
jgi:hypothetical protein